MNSVPLEKWEVESGRLDHRAEQLLLAAADFTLPIRGDERVLLRKIADRLKAEAREVVRRG